MRFTARIEYEAKKAAEVQTTDPERVKAFRQGAYFTACYLRDVMSVHPMEPPSVEAYLDKLRLKDVREALSFLLQGVPDEE